MEIQALFDPKRKKEIIQGLKKGKIPPRAKPRFPQPAAPALASTKEEQEEANGQLKGATLEGNLEEVKGALAKGADVNAADSGGYTALLLASISGHTEIMELLKQHGATE